MKAGEHFAQRRKGPRKDAKEIRLSFFASLRGPLRLCAKFFLVALVLTSCTPKPTGPLAFVTNERDGTITVIDTGTNRVFSTIKVGGRVRGIRLNPDRTRIWVAISYPTNQS